MSADLCVRCGRCCLRKFRLAPGMPAFAVSDMPCRFLDPRTNLCTVYERRREAAPWCLTAEQALAREALPADCPYVRDSGRVGTGYRGPKVVLLRELPRDMLRMMGLGR